MARFVRTPRNIDCIHAEGASTSKLTREQAQAVISALCGTTRRTEPVQVISAFDVPRVQYDPIRKIFYQQPARASLHGTAEVSTPVFVSWRLTAQQWVLAAKAQACCSRRHAAMHAILQLYCMTRHFR